MADTQSERRATGQVALRRAVTAWFLVAATGQIAFVAMILVHYAGKTVLGNYPGWNDKPLIKGYVAGDAAGNVMFGVHVLLAAVMTIGGLMQLVPSIRERAPGLHRWNGRLFVVLALLMAIGGLWLTWGRQTWLSPISAIAVSLDGLLILAFTAIAWRHAVRRRFAAHRRWALRMFMVVSGVWFLRIAIMAWVITIGKVGMNATMSGPANIAQEFGSYLIPLAALEAYFYAQRRPDAFVRRLVAGVIVASTAVTAIGVAGAITFMWLPVMIS